MSKDKDYRVGYGRPPKASRIKPGEVRNPWGRGGRQSQGKRALAPDSPSPDDVFAQERHREIAFTENNKRKKAPINQIAIRRLYAKAAEGDMAAIREVGRFERDERERGARAAQHSRDLVYEYVALCEQEYRRCLEWKLPMPEFEPHPDDLIIDRYGKVHWITPLTPARKREERRELAFIEQLKEAIADRKEMIASDPPPAERYRSQLARHRKALRAIMQRRNEIDDDFYHRILEAQARRAKREAFWRKAWRDRWA